jgi:4'-phosphopantetheinyl transferase
MAASPAAADTPSQALAAQWMTAPAQPRLGAGELHVWQADLRTVGDATQDTLSAQERARAAAIADPRTRALWARSRAMLRALLGRYLQLPPSALQIVNDERGKPSLLAAGGRQTRVRSPCFSLSHSGHLALYGFAAAGAIGVDVQLARVEPRGSGERRWRTPRDHVALARRAFGKREAERLRALPVRLREAEFLRLWTRYEAELKCLGIGIGGERARLGADRWVLDLDLERREQLPPAAAVVAARAPRTLRLWRS